MSEKQQNGIEFESMRKPANEALLSAFTKLVRESRKSGASLVIWKDGKVCHIPASEIRIPEDKSEK